MHVLVGDNFRKIDKDLHGGNEKKRNAKLKSLLKVNFIQDILLYLGSRRRLLLVTR